MNLTSYLFLNIAEELDSNRWYCEACPMNYESQEELIEHEKTHEAERPYICILCEKDFALKSSLRRHILSHHGVDPTPLIESDKCLKKSDHASGLLSTSVIKDEASSMRYDSRSRSSSEVSSI